MAASSRVVCWRNREEWIETYQSLFNFEQPNLQRKAIERVQAWKSRSNWKLPLAIESTSNLMAAHLALTSQPNDSEDSPGFVEKKLLLAMALVRFVNGMVDVEQKGMYARSMQSIAEEIGLPDWLIDLRHEATHAHLPSLATLRSGLRVALAWLRDEYWEAQLSRQDDNRDSIVPLLEDYKERGLLGLIAKVKKPSKNARATKSHQAASAETVRGIASMASSGNLWNEILSVLVDGQLLCCSSEDLTKLGSGWPAVPEDHNGSLPCLPRHIISLWKPLFNALNKVSSKFIPSLLMSLIESLPEAGEASEEFAGWVNHFLAASTVLRWATDDLSWFLLLEKSMVYFSPYSSALISIILKHMPQASQALQEKIKALPLVFEGTTDSPHVYGQHYSVDDLHELRDNKIVDESAFRETNQPQNSQEPWSPASGATPWHKIPLGEVLAAGNQLPNNLELFQTDTSAHLSSATFKCQDDASIADKSMENEGHGEESITELEGVPELGTHEALSYASSESVPVPMDSESLDIAGVAGGIWLL